MLFIGNSLTYYNNLPGTLIDLALMSGDSIRAGIVAYPDFVLVDHLNQGAAIRAIASKRSRMARARGRPSLVVNDRQV